MTHDNKYLLFVVVVVPKYANIGCEDTSNRQTFTT